MSNVLPAIRIGQGFDLHRLSEGIPLKLGGLTIDFEKGSVGHSDGDVVLHALIDALLGALGEGDIGDWFPPGDASTRGIDSGELLQRVLNDLKRRWPDFCLVNVDITMFLERPKLGGLKVQMKDHVAHLLGIEPSRVSIKAKTAEGFFPVGTSDAVAASVICLVTL